MLDHALAVGPCDLAHVLVDRPQVPQHAALERPFGDRLDISRTFVWRLQREGAAALAQARVEPTPCLERSETHHLPEKQEHDDDMRRNLADTYPNASVTRQQLIDYMQLAHEWGYDDVDREHGLMPAGDNAPSVRDWLFGLPGSETHFAPKY